MYKRPLCLFLTNKHVERPQNNMASKGEGRCYGNHACQEGHVGTMNTNSLNVGGANNCHLYENGCVYISTYWLGEFLYSLSVNPEQEFYSPAWHTMTRHVHRIGSRSIYDFHCVNLEYDQIFIFLRIQT